MNKFKSIFSRIGLLIAVVTLTGCQFLQSAILDNNPPEPTTEAAVTEPTLQAESDQAVEEPPAVTPEAETVLRVGDLLNNQNPDDQSDPESDSNEQEAATNVVTNSTELSATDPISDSIPPAEIASNEGEAPQPQFAIGNELTIEALRAQVITGSEINIEQTLANGANYSQYIASYLSEGNRIYGLLTVPFGEPPAGGFKAVVFNHGYIPPAVYSTTERYVDYVGTLANSGLVVFKIDLRGHGNSEGEATGSYFSPNYTIDAISALKSLQTLDYVDPQGIGMWGHSMAGNLVLRAMLVEPDVKAAVIWAGAVYSYDDLTRYAITDTSFDRNDLDSGRRFERSREIRETYGQPDTSVPYWQAVSLTNHLEYLNNPIQLHHATNDDVVNIGYSIDLAAILAAENKAHEFYSYDVGGHNISSPAFNQAMQRTIAFFLANL